MAIKLKCYVGWFEYFNKDLFVAIIFDIKRLATPSISSNCGHNEYIRTDLQEWFRDNNIDYSCEVRDIIFFGINFLVALFDKDSQLV